MKKVKIVLTFIDEIEEGFDVHLQAGEPWAYKEAERQLAERLNVDRVVIDEIFDTDLELPESKY